jgi:hypothetical protein
MLAGLLLVGVGEASAHDFWIEPSTYHPGVPSLLGVRLHVGERFGRGEPYARSPSHIRSFVMAGPSGTRPVLGRSGDDPAGLARVDAPGVYVIGYRSNHGTVELEAARFEEYLREEHLEEVSRRRAQRGQRDAPGREAFSRCAKAIVVAGDGNDEGYDRVLGFTLELVPEQSPTSLRPGDELSIRLLYDGRPLPDAHVAAVNAAAGGARSEGRTDTEGRARLRLDRDGVWLVRSVHMIPAAGGLDADWESFWASLTLHIAASH